MSLLWSHLIAWPSNGGCSLAGPTFSANQAEDLGSDSLCLSTVFLWLTGNKLLDVDHCADYRPHNIVSPVIVLEALSRRPPVIMTFDKLPINNRVICDSRLFGGPRSRLRWATALWALGLGEWGVKVENTDIRVLTGLRWSETFRWKIIPWSEAQSWFWDGQSWEWSPKRHPSPLIRIRSFCKEQICGINLHFTFLVTGLGVSCHYFGPPRLQHNCLFLAMTRVLGSHKFWIRFIGFTWDSVTNELWQENHISEVS